MAVVATTPTSSVANAELRVAAVSPRVGMVFADNENVQIEVQVTGANGAATVEYTITETEGPYKTHGQIAAGAEGTILPLKLPGRGHYQLTLVATSQGQTAKSISTIGIVFPPAKPEAASPWGVMYTPPNWFGRKDYVQSAEDSAENLRMLGVSWVRYNFYLARAEPKIARRGGNPNVTTKFFLEPIQLKPLRQKGFIIMGEICGMPTPLSTRPNEHATVRDAGELRNRVKPRDYALWDSLVTNIAAEFRKDISAWEIWNEPNQPSLGYWADSPDEFLEFVEHTSKALRAGNPQTKVVGCGFVHVNDVIDHQLQRGMAKYLDVISVHYVNEYPEIQAWQDLLKKHDVALPIWCTEERVEVPTIAFSHGVERNFDFMHVGLPGPPGEGEYHALCNTDFTVRPTGIWFSVGAHCIGSGKFTESAKLGNEDYLAAHFARGKEDVFVLTRLKDKADLIKLALDVQPLNAQKPVTITDRMGHSENLVLKDGRVQIALENRPMLFVNGAAAVSIIEPK